MVYIYVHLVRKMVAYSSQPSHQDPMLCVSIGDGDTHIDTGSLTTTMRSVKDSFWTRGEKLLPLNYVDCDGGEQKSESSGSLQPRELINYDSSNFTSDGMLVK